MFCKETTGTASVCTLIRHKLLSKTLDHTLHSGTNPRLQQVHLGTDAEVVYVARSKRAPGSRILTLLGNQCAA